MLAILLYLKRFIANNTSYRNLYLYLITKLEGREYVLKYCLQFCLMNCMKKEKHLLKSLIRLYQ